MRVYISFGLRAYTKLNFTHPEAKRTYKGLFRYLRSNHGEASLATRAYKRFHAFTSCACDKRRIYMRLKKQAYSLA